jgi:hypothetical protein
MELIAEEKYFNPEKAWTMLCLVAKHIEDPVKLKEMETRWLRND